MAELAMTFMTNVTKLMIVTLKQARKCKVLNVSNQSAVSFIIHYLDMISAARESCTSSHHNSLACVERNDFNVSIQLLNNFKLFVNRMYG